MLPRGSAADGRSRNGCSPKTASRRRLVETLRKGRRLCEGVHDVKAVTKTNVKLGKMGWKTHAFDVHS